MTTTQKEESINNLMNRYMDSMADIRFDWLEDHWVTQYKKKILK